MATDRWLLRLIAWLRGGSATEPQREAIPRITEEDLRRIGEEVVDQINRRMLPEHPLVRVLMWSGSVALAGVLLVFAVTIRPADSVSTVIDELGDRWQIDLAGTGQVQMAGDVAKLDLLSPPTQLLTAAERSVVEAELKTLPVVAIVHLLIPDGCDQVNESHYRLEELPIKPACADGEYRLLAPVSFRWPGSSSIEVKAQVEALSLQRREALVPAAANPFFGNYLWPQEIIGFAGRYIETPEVTVASPIDQLQVIQPYRWSWWSDTVFDPETGQPEQRGEPSPVAFIVVAEDPDDFEIAFSRPLDQDDSVSGSVTVFADGFESISTVNLGGIVTIGAEQLELLRPMSLEASGRYASVGFSFDSSLSSTEQLVANVESAANVYFNGRELLPSAFERWNVAASITTAAVVGALVAAFPRRSFKQLLSKRRSKK